MLLPASCCRPSITTDFMRLEIRSASPLSQEPSNRCRSTHVIRRRRNDWLVIVEGGVNIANRHNNLRDA